MAQTSLMAWLKKPAAVTQAPKASERDPEPGQRSTSNSFTSTITHDDSSSGASPKATAKLETTTASHISEQIHPTLPPNVELRPCTRADISSLKRLTSLLLPIPYPDSFYREILEDEATNRITLLAFWHDDDDGDVAREPSTQNGSSHARRRGPGRLVGAMRCRILPAPASDTAGPMLYLSTLVLLSPYRRHGIAAHMLSIMTRRAATEFGARSVGAHVWTANEIGREWYRRRGFREVGVEEGYYRRLQPDGAAVVVRREIGVLDLIREGE